MSPEIRRAALLIAAKTTILTTIGCSNGLSPAPGPAPTSDTPTAGSPAAAAPTTPAATPAATAQKPCAEHLDGLATIDTSKLPNNDPLHGDTTVFGAFADVAARNDPRTQECCREELTRDNSAAAHRWACCSALPEKDREGQAMACTPWGPPCPPPLLT